MESAASRISRMTHRSPPLSGSNRATGTTFGDLVGKLDSVIVECPKCSRTGRYALRRLIEQRGRDADHHRLPRRAHRRLPAQARRDRQRPVSRAVLISDHEYVELVDEVARGERAAVGH
jgi:hypothetical protein